MTREQLEHIIRAVGDITGEKEVIIIGSQAILGQHPDLPSLTLSDSDSLSVLIMSIEADIIVPGAPEKADIIDAVIGELSQFHDTYGYYAQGVDFTTPTLPAGWKGRLIEISNENTGYFSGLCLEIHDLFISKLIAGREKDINFCSSLLKNRMVELNIIKDRLKITELSPDVLSVVQARLLGCINK